MNAIKSLMIAFVGTLFGLVITGSAFSANRLSVFDWAGYENPEFFKSYVDKYGTVPDFTFFGDEQEAINKVRTGFKPDLAHPCTSSLSLWRKAGLITPIDVSRIERWDNVLPELKDVVTHDGKVWMVPFDAGYSSLIYRTDKVKEGDLNFGIFSNPDYKGRVTYNHGVYEAYGLAFNATGTDSWHGISESQYEKATKWLRRTHEYVRSYWSSPAELAREMASGSIEAAWAWNTTLAQLKAENIPVSRVVKGPARKPVTWVCGYVALKDSDAEDGKVYDFLNALLDARSGKYLIEQWGYAHSSAESYKRADEKILKNTGLSDIEKVLKNSFFADSPPEKLREKMNRTFVHIKAGF